MRDMLGILIFIASILASLAASAFFSGTETGLLSVSHERILHLARKGGRRAQMVQRALADMDRTTATLLVGNNIANVAYSTTSTAAILALVSDSAVRSAASFAAAVIVLYFGEFLPKLLFSARPLRRILLVAPLYQAIATLLHPLAKLSLVLTNVFLRNRSTGHKMTADEIRRIIRDRRDGVCLTDFEHTLITDLLAWRTSGTPVTKERVYSSLAKFEPSDKHKG